MTIDWRNFFGAVGGTFLGILTMGSAEWLGGSIQWYASPLAALIGAIMGYHHRIIGHEIAAMIDGSAQLIRDPRSFALALLTSLSAATRGRKPDARTTARLTIGLAAAVFLGCVTCLWLAVYLIAHYMLPRELADFISGACMFYFFLVSALSLAIVSDGRTHWGFGSKQEWAYWCMPRGRYFVLALRDMCFIFSGVCVVGAYAILWFLVVGGAYTIVILAPITIVCGITKGLYVAARRGGYVPSFTISLAAMVTTAATVGTNYQSWTVLWLTAACAGILAGAFAECGRLTYCWVAQYNPHCLAHKTIGDCVKPVREAFGRLSARVGLEPKRKAQRKGEVSDMGLILV